MIKPEQLSWRIALVLLGLATVLILTLALLSNREDGAAQANVEPPTFAASSMPPATTTSVAPTSTPVKITPTVVANEQISATLLPPRYPKVVDEARVEAILMDLTLEQKIGQMLMVGVPDARVDAVARRRVVQQGVGGIIFLDRNATSAEQIASFTSALQAAAMEEGPGLPLFIGWNQEGGPIARMNSGITHFPSAMALGAADDPDLVYQIGQAIGDEMQTLGVNMNYAPVLDVNVESANPVIGLRAFGDEPALVARLGEAYIRGQQDSGIIAVAKHFPGHGGVDVDSHVSLPRLTAPLEVVQQIDLPPFAAALGANVGGVMVAHLQIPALDAAGTPASLSPNIVQDLLRREMGYEGVIMTDDMGMGAVLNHYSLSEATIQAVLAGNDLLLMAESEPYMAGYADMMYVALLNAVNSGRLLEKRIDASVRRLIRLKLAYELDTASPPAVLSEQDDHEELARMAGQSAVQLIRDSKNWLPLSLPQKKLLLVSPNGLHPGSTSGDGLSLLAEMLIMQGIDVVETFYIPGAPWSITAAQQEALALAPSVDAVVVITWNAILRYKHQQEVAQETLVNELLSSGQSVIVVFGQLPYDRERVPQAPAQIAMYGDTVGQIEGLIALLIGKSGG